MDSPTKDDERSGANPFAAGPDAAESTPAAPGLVLILDEDRAAGAIAEDILVGAGHDVRRSGDLGAGLLIATERPVDVVVVDLFSTNAPGFPLIDELRRANDGVSLGPEVVVTSACDDVDVAVASLHYGAADYLVKPISSARLQAAIARAMERRRLLIDENSRLRRDLALFAAGQRLLETLDEKQLASRGIEALCSFCEASAAAVFGPQGLIDHRGLDEVERAAIAEVRVPLHWSQRTRPKDLHEELRRFTDAMLLDLGEERGVILLRAAGIDGQGARFDDLHEQNALFLSRHLSTGFKNVVRFSIAEQRARRDPLTGLYNARAFEEALHHAILRGTLEEGRFSLLFLDLDHFKRVNDAHGHLIGSQLLVELGHVLSRCVRDGDVVGRYGGDEFMLLLQDVDAEAAHSAAERIRATVEEHRFLSREGPRVTLTACIGVVAFPEHGTDARTLLDMADRAMYLGKAASRNTVRLAASLEGEKA